MELDHYIKLSSIPESFIKIKETNKITFPESQSVNYNLPSSVYVNYLFVFTFERKAYDSQVLLSSYNSVGGKGYTLGVNSNNELFIDYPLKSFCYTFKLKFGNKNCIAIKKQNNFFTIYLYDVISGLIQDSELAIVPDSDGTFSSSNSETIIAENGSEILLENNEFIFTEDNIQFGDNSNYIGIPQNRNSIHKFSGSFDQMLFISGVIGDSNLNTIFKGFRPETITNSEYTKLNYEEGYSWKSNDLKKYKSYFSNFFSKIDSYTNTGLFFGNGYFSSTETGYFGSGGLNLDIKYYTGQSMTGDSIREESVYSGMPDSITKYIYNATSVIHKNENVTFALRDVCLKSGIKEYRFSYATRHSQPSIQTGYLSSFDSGYYSGFMFDGTFSNKKISFSYGALSGIAPNYYQNVGNFSFEKNAFEIPNYSKFLTFTGKPSGSIFLINGQVDLSGVISGGCFIPSSDYKSSDVLIYHENPNLTKMFVFDNFSSGRFWPRTSININIEKNYSNYLQINTDYEETTTGNIYHLQKNTERGSYLINSI